ncbi:sugar MFS transporter [Seonamhaeicola sp. ML3]|uniref:sugar MFS transporter n=1 Tax=Seonamhaeicola sp. ML3 TaxID=2937786 RepID=UPI00200E5305|nr:sugar MFS transporter [Seonamhaeicola sp. ML3]
MSKQEVSNKSNANYLVPILIIGGLFFIFGFVTWVNGALIPYMKVINELTEAQSFLVASASYISFVVMALPASNIISRLGYQKSMSLGLVVMGLGALVFIPAANARTYWMFLTGLFIQGAGMTLLQTASNPYITILGPIESGAKRIAIMGIANKVAGGLGSIIFGAILLTGIDGVSEKLKVLTDIEKESLLNDTASEVVVPYIVMAVVLFILGVLIRKVSLPDVSAEPIVDENNRETTKKSILQFPHLLLGVLVLFVYVGAEVIAGDSIITYGISLGISPDEAKFFTSFTLLAMVATYALGVFLIPKYISQSIALRSSAILGIIFSFCILFTEGFTSIIFVAALGIANALVWPAVWPLALTGLGKFTEKGSALLIMAISGGAIIPPIYGYIVDSSKEKLIQSGLNEATAITESATNGYWVLLPCYIIILFYAFWGYKVGLKRSNH